MSKRIEYMPQLDGLRAIAILLVLYGHFHSTLSQIFIPLAWLGVQLFFVLSGYLITRIILNQRSALQTGQLELSKAIKTFYIRRALRLTPMYYCVLLVFMYFNFDAGKGIWPYLFLYMTNIKIVIDDAWLGMFSHLWSLAAEEQFYLIWPWLIFLLPTKKLPTVLLMIICSGIVFRSLMVSTGQSIYTNTLLFGVTDALGMGALLALVANSDREMVKKQFFKFLPYFALTGLLGSGFIFIQYEWTSTAFRIWAGFLCSLSFTWLVWRASCGFTGVLGYLLGSPPAIFLGKISYGVYVIHAFIPNLLLSLGVQPDHLPNAIDSWFYLIVITTLVLASISWFLIERPANQFKSHFKY